jgi:hypothetical protein
MMQKMSFIKYKILCTLYVLAETMRQLVYCAMLFWREAKGLSLCKIGLYKAIKSSGPIGKYSCEKVAKNMNELKLHLESPIW